MAGCCQKLGKVFLVVINLIFLLLGLGLLVAGILVKINALSSDVTPALDTIVVADYKLGELTNNLSVVFIVIGAFITVVSGLGVIGACCKVKWMLIVYTILVLILLIMKIAAVALWFKMRGEFNDNVKKVMVDALNKEYVSDRLNSTNVVSNAWNYIFMTFDCCGVNPVNKTNNDFSTTPWCTNNNCTAIPRTCCSGVDQSNYLTKAQPVCYKDVSKDYNSKGCYQAIQDLIATYGNAFIGISITVIVVEILAVIYAIMICRQDDDN
uniref:Tetraspanin n=1 Tax=Crassostrea virginica TaxID=6565 RepID=A0A8B8DIF7_CRAVI|nr:tetraspanin-9-like [Crassostrea virginica]